MEKLPAVPVAVPIVPINEFLIAELFSIVVEPEVIVIFPKSSSVVGLVIAGGVEYVGAAADSVVRATKLKLVVLPAQTVVGDAAAVAVIPALGFITVILVVVADPVHPELDSDPFMVKVYVPAAVGVITNAWFKVPEVGEVNPDPAVDAAHVSTNVFPIPPD